MGYHAIHHLRLSVCLSVKMMFDADIDECLSRPCHNGAVCEDNVGGYTCFCAEGFEGDHCQLQMFPATPQSPITRPSNDAKKAFQASKHATATGVGVFFGFCLMVTMSVVGFYAHQRYKLNKNNQKTVKPLVATASDIFHLNAQEPQRSRNTNSTTALV
jgi:hypothetical protein